MKLSILEQVPIAQGESANDALHASLELAKLGDKLGYTRFWVAEHHDLPGLACPAPDVLLGMIGQKTTNIRIGSGAVLLPHYKPFNIAERYNLLATIFPERVDLGIGRAPGGSAEATMALADNFLEQVRHMPERLNELLHFLNNNFPDTHMFSKISPAPVPHASPEPWLLGTSEKSAYLAAEKGMAYAFGHFMSDKDGPQIMETYREELQKKHPKKHAKTIVAVTVFCAETTEKAADMALSSQLWKIKQDKGEAIAGLPTVEEAKAYAYTNEEKETVKNMQKKAVIGNPAEVKGQLLALQDRYKAEEFMLVTNTHNRSDRLNSYRLIAKEMFK